MKQKVWPIVLVLAVIVAILADATGALNGVSEIRTRWWPAPTPLAFEAAAPDETLILVAQFHTTTATDSEPDVKIIRRIREELQKLGEQNIRVEFEPTELAADDRKEAESLGGRYDASMIIWGEDTGVEVVVNFLNLQQPDFSAAEERITEHPWRMMSTANPDPYAHFITTDLPGHLAFLTLYAIAQSYLFSEQYPRAVQAFERAVTFSMPSEHSGVLSDAHAYLGWLYKAEVKSTERALASYNRAIVTDPRNSWAYTNRGNIHLGNGQVEEAIKDYDTAIAIDPRDSVAYTNRGAAYAERENWEEAIKNYNKAIEIDSRYAAAFYNRGLAHSNLGRQDSAINDYDAVITIDPEFAAAYYNRAGAYAALGSWEDAQRDYDIAIQIDPSSPQAFNNRGNAYLTQGLWKEAIQDYDEAIEIDPNHLSAYNNRAIAQAKLGNWEDAIRDYNKVIQADPDYIVAYINRGTVFAEQGLWVDAIRDYSKVIESDPSDGTAYSGRGVAYAQQGRLEEAVSDLSAAISLGDSCAYLRRGLVNIELGDFPSASADLREYANALANVPSHADDLPKYEAWIASLNSGVSPFTPEELAQLLHES